MKLQHLRHATHRLIYNGKTILVDPVFSPANTLPPIPGAPNGTFNPQTELPVPIDVLCTSDLLLVTHTHSDHFDGAAAEALPKTMHTICSPHDESILREKGFTHQTVVTDRSWVDGIEIFRTGGTHGTGPSAPMLNPVSGYVLKALGEPTLYITGDTVWCDEMQNALSRHQPDIIIAYGGAALYAGDTITMGIPDFEHIRAACPESKLVVIHTNGWNHCGLTREAVRQWAKETKQEPWVRVPEDGESIIMER